MNVEADLKKDGIKVIEKIDTLKVNSLSNSISSCICNTFPEFNFQQEDLFIKLSRLNMYRASMPAGMAEATFFYKNDSIYFNEHIEDEDLKEFAIHECLHFLQQKKDNKGNLLRMGLCDYTEFKTYGLGLNEAAVQLIASKINNIPKEYVKYYDLEFETTSPAYYPLECCLVNQLATITGLDVLFESTIHSNDNFKNKFCELTSFKTFLAIENSIDKILDLEESIISFNNKIVQTDNDKKVDCLINKISEYKQELKLTFLRTQNLIISSYFDNAFDKITNLEDIENYRRNLYRFKDVLANSDGYTFFNDYYVSKMIELEEKYNALENVGSFMALKVISKREGKLIKLIRAIKKLIFGKSTIKDVNL